jgi:pimeloyl-ACP methyl ester carboxylesterase
MRILLWVLVGLAALIAVAFLALGDPEMPREQLLHKYGGAPSQFIGLPSGAKAHYRVQGKSGGATVLLLHGSNASLHTWEPWVGLLGDEFSLVTVDLPGHGLTIAKGDETYTAASMAAFADEFARAVGLERYAVGGNSMGGHVAGRVAMAYPARVSALILIGSGGVLPPDLPPPPAMMQITQVPVLRELLRLVPTRPIYEAGLKASFVNQSLVTPAMIDRYWELNRGPGIRAATRTRLRVGLDYWQAEDRYFRATLPKLAMPTLILWGRQDKLLPVSGAEIFRQAIPGAQAIIYDDGGHIVQEDVAERSAADVRAFLRGAVAAPPH